jgi:hypothetical protein
MENEEINYEEFYPGFTVTCKKCNGQHVHIENDMGYSPESGSWGGLHFVCDDCGATVSIYEN